MQETTGVRLYIRMISGRRYVIETTTTELDWLYDKMFGRSDIKFQNFDSEVINVGQIEHLRYYDIKEDDASNNTGI